MCSIEHEDLKRIEELLTCGICYEYMDTTMVTSCSHNYCSLCIRKYLHYKTQCPTCYEETFEKDLRKNKILDEIIEQYLNFKEQLEKKSHGEETPTTKDKDSRPQSLCSQSNNEYERQQVVSNTNKVSPKTSDNPVLEAGTPSTSCGRKNQQDVSTPSTSTELRIPLIFTPKRRKGFRNEESCQVVTCPVCKVDVPQSNINKHLDDCLKRENTKDQLQNVTPKRKPLPKLVLSLMKDNMIRKKLKELGLLSQGDRKALENRLQKYTILYNAECDKTNPRPVSELIKQCEEEENFERKEKKPSNRLNINRNTDHTIIEQERKKYLADNKNSFNDLITNIKHADNPSKLPVRRNILSANKNHVAKNNPTSQNSDFLLFEPDNPHIDESDSNASCPLQMYSSEHPMKFLKVELSSSSNDSDQCASNDISNRLCKPSPFSHNTNIKQEIIDIDASLEDSSTHTEMFSNLNECNIVSENGIDNDTKELIPEFIGSESESREKIVLPARHKWSTTCSPKRHVKYSESKDKWQKELRDDDLIVENSDSDPDDPDDYEKSRHEQLHVNNKETYELNDMKFEKENLDSLDEKETCVLHKREREIVITLSDDEKNEERSTSIRKSARLGLSEAKGFNNEVFDENTRGNNEEEKSQGDKKKRATRAIHAKNPRRFMKRTVKLQNGIGKR